MSDGLTVPSPAAGLTGAITQTDNRHCRAAEIAATVRSDWALPGCQEDAEHYAKERNERT